jgi:asparagine synthase (glutamine-hydrolysing)
MLEAISSRGPDDRRVVTGEWFCLGVCRLSIMATQAGTQPVSTPDRAVALGFNGELYDFGEQVQALRRTAGVAVRSEAELLLHRYLREGPTMFGRLDGDFAIAVFDSRDRTCFLARDRWGVKPLFYAVLPDGNGAAVASEVRALLRHRALPLDWDEVTLAERHALWFSSSQRTLLRQISQVRPGHWVRLRLPEDSPCAAVQVEEVPYAARWTRPQADGADLAADPEALVARCHDTIDAATRRQAAHTEVEPVVVALSGGVDSTILMAAAHGSAKQVVAVTVGAASSLDGHYASLVAKSLGVDHYVYDVTVEDVLQALPRLILSMGGSGPAYTPYFLGEAVRHHVPEAKVLLCGEGADEVFSGYWMHVDPGRYLEHVKERIDSLGSDWGSRSPLLRGLAAMGTGPNHDGAYEQLTRLFQQDQLASNHLVPFDHATMAHGVECRVPFLDASIFDLVQRFPDLGRVIGRTSKPALRLVLSRILMHDPGLHDAILSRMPSGAPMATEPARTRLREILRDELDNAPVLESPLAGYARGLEDLFWLGAFDVIFLQRRGEIDGMTFEDLLEGVKHAG